MPKDRTINVSDFKAKALQFIAEVSKKGREYVITRKGIPVARVLPFQKRVEHRLGSLKGLIEIHGDIVHFDTSEDWEVLSK